MQRGCLFVMYKTNFPPESERLRDKAPNKPFKVGRDIRILHKLDPYLAVTVSPYHPEFKTQVESGIWPLVKILNEKGYHTTSSCEGHYNQDNHKSSPMIIVCFTSDISKQMFINKIKSLPGIMIEDNIDEQLFNTEYDPMSETFHNSPSTSNTQQQVEYLNDMFMRKSDYYTFARIHLNMFVGRNPISWLDRHLLGNRLSILRMIRRVKNMSVQ